MTLNALQIAARAANMTVADYALYLIQNAISGTPVPSYSETGNQLFGNDENKDVDDILTEYATFKAANPGKYPLFENWFISNAGFLCLLVTYSTTGETTYSQTGEELFGNDPAKDVDTILTEYAAFKVDNPLKYPLFENWFTTNDGLLCLLVTYKN